MKSSKGTINITTFSTIQIRKGYPFENFSKETVLSDLIYAATLANFKNAKDEIMNFEFIDFTDEHSYGNLIQVLTFRMIDFSGIHFTMSFSENEHERNKFRSWSKFWTELTKIGYKVK